MVDQEKYRAQPGQSESPLSPIEGNNMFTKIPRLAVAAAVTAVAAAGGGIAALASSAAPATVSLSAPAPAVFYGCDSVNAGQSGHPVRMIFDVFEHPVTCPAGSFGISWNQQGPAGPQGPKGDTGAAGPQGPAGPSDLTVTATTSVSSRDDSGNQGNWARDAFIRTITITRHEAANVLNCGGAVATCWYYTGTITDAGTFLTDAGAKTPNKACTEPAPSSASCDGLVINGQVAGNFTGGSHIEFYASSNAPNASLVPATVSGNSPSTGNWYQQFFPGGTVFSGAANLIDWSWNYSAPKTCETWTDAWNNGDGNGNYVPVGNIAGINECPV